MEEGALGTYPTTALSSLHVIHVEKVVSVSQERVSVESDHPGTCILDFHNPQTVKKN